jgi:hypothetical protein
MAVEPPGMEPNARAELSELLEGEDAEAHLTLAWRPKAGVYDVRQVEIEKGLGKQFLAYARASAAQLAEERVAVTYDPEWPLKDSEYFALTEGQIPGGNLFPDLADFLNLESFERKKMKKPRLYSVAVQGGAETALFGKRMANLTKLGRSGMLLPAIWNGDTFNTLEDLVLTFSTKFDWVLWRETLFVLDAKNYHGEFRDSVALRAAVQEHVDAICESVEIVGAAEFVKRCQSTVSMSSKLQSVFENGIWREPVANLKAYASERGIEVRWDGDRLVFDGSLEHQHAILKLLDEDRTHGPVSGRTYDSAAKQTVELGPKD